MGASAPGRIGGFPGVAIRMQEKLFPRMLHHNLPRTFSYSASNFRVQKSKEQTARIVCWRELGLINSFTLEVMPRLSSARALHFGQRWAATMPAGLVCGTLHRPECRYLRQRVPLSARHFFYFGDFSLEL